MRRRHSTILLPPQTPLPSHFFPRLLHTLQITPSSSLAPHTQLRHLISSHHTMPSIPITSQLCNAGSPVSHRSGSDVQQKRVDATDALGADAPALRSTELSKAGQSWIGFGREKMQCGLMVCHRCAARACRRATSAQVGPVEKEKEKESWIASLGRARSRTMVTSYAWVLVCGRCWE